MEYSRGSAPATPSTGAQGYLQSKLFRVGLALFVLGVGPLLLIMLAAAIGLWPDPNPNPVGPGLLAALTFWPSLICLGLGAWRTKQDRKNASR